MSSKALLTGSLTILFLGGILAEYTPGIVATAASPPSKKGAVALPPAPTSMLPSVSQDAAPSLSANDPLAARDEGYRRIAGFQSANEFDRAAGFALSGPAELRRDWIIAAYHEWGCRQPESAFASATKIQDAAARETALESVFTGWARTDPAGLAELALNRPDGPEKNAALTKAMRAWIQQDPWKAGDWIVAHESVIPLVDTMVRHDRR